MSWCGVLWLEILTGNLTRLARRVIDPYELKLVNHFEIEEQVLFQVMRPMR